MTDLLFKGLVPLNVAADGLAHHGVLAHEDDGSATQTHTDLLHLLGADIVCAHNEALGVVIQKLLSNKTHHVKIYQDKLKS